MPGSQTSSETAPAGGVWLTAVDHVFELVIEILILGLAVVSPWLFGAVHPAAEFLLAAGVSVVALLAGVRMLLTRQFHWMGSGFAICLALLFLLDLAQLVPLSNDTLQKLSPATAELYGQLLPLQAEKLPAGAQPPSLAIVPGATISVYPAVTHRESIRHLQLLLLFLAIRSTAPALRSIQRLCLVLTCNGAVMAIFGLIQCFTAETNVIYWNYPTLGQVFGPFINRNHYACYINLIIGLALGLLLSRVSAPAPNTSKSRRNEHELPWYKRLVQDSSALWLSFAVALMVCSTAFSLSRGGILALIAGFAACFLLSPKRSSGRVRFEMAFVVLLIAGGMIYWVGIERVGSRLATLWSADVLREHRPRLWADSLAAAARFPLGTGSGTFSLVEPMFRSAPADVVFSHPENELVEALLEGGLARLVLTIGFVAFAFFSARRAISQPVTPAAGGLAVGMLFSVVSLATHSLGDFAIHLPAVAFLAIVVVAYLEALGDLSAASKVSSTRSTDAAPALPQRRVMMPLAAGLMMLALAFVVAGENWRELRIRRYRDFARLPANLDDVAGVQQAISFLTAAEELAPDSAEVQLALARAHFLVLEQELKSAGRSQLKNSPPPALDFGLPLAHLVAARNLSPLLTEAQLQLAAERDAFERADRAANYLDRAALLAPTDAHVWYLCGLQALADFQQETAWQQFRRSLELSGEYLPKILARAKPPLVDTEVIAKLLPEKAPLLVAAANQLYPQADLASLRGPYFHRAVEILDQEKSLSPSDWALKAQIHMALLEPEKAIAGYENALEMNPEQVEWRFELAKLLRQEGRVDDARRELSLILGQQPNHSAARQLADSVSRELAQGKR